MPICRDPMMRYFASFGFNVAGPPRPLMPLHVLLKRRGGLQDIGPAGDLWESDISPPEVVSRPSAEFSGLVSARMRRSMGLAVLESVLSGWRREVRMEALREILSNAWRMAFLLPEVEVVNASPLSVDRFISRADLRMNTSLMAGPLSDHGHLDAYVVTDSARADRFAMVGIGRAGETVPIDAPALSAALGPDFRVARSTTRDDIMVVGPEPLTFAFRMFAVSVIDGEWRLTTAKDAVVEGFAVETREERLRRSPPDIYFEAAPLRPPPDEGQQPVAEPNPGVVLDPDKKQFVEPA
jgi:hypothetical protein